MEKEDLAFMSELESAAHLKPSRAANLFLWTIVGFFVWVVVWAWISEVDERIHGIGQVMPSSDTQVVQSLEGGIITELAVSEGDKVAKGQVILRIDDVQFASEGRGIEAQMAALQAKQARLKAEASGEPFVVPPDLAKDHPDVAAGEEKLYHSRQKQVETDLAILIDEVREAEANLGEVRASIAKLSQSRKLLQDELAITSRLVAQKAVPEIEKLRLERELNEVTGTLASAARSRESLEARVSGVRKKEELRKGDFRSAALSELSEVEARIASIGESLTAAQDRVSRTDLRAPVDGVVQRVYVKTVGGVVQPAQRLVEIVPDTDDLMIRARISPADVAFLKPGQNVRVSITAYDPQVYGTLKGRLERIGADTVEDQQGNSFFEIDVRTERNALDNEGGRPLPIVPGMVAETNVIVGKRTILTYLMKPVLRAKDKAFTEK